MVTPHEGRAAKDCRTRNRIHSIVKKSLDHEIEYVIAKDDYTYIRARIKGK